MDSQSTKSESASERPASKWRGTLRRHPNFRPIEIEDIKYLWAAYKSGSLSTIGMNFDKEMTPAEFKDAIEHHILSSFHAAWALFGPTKMGFIPTGFVFASWAPNAQFMIVSVATFMPWASKRNIIECSVDFLSNVRKEFQLQFYASPEHKRLYEICAIHGAVRRVGTSYVAIPGQIAAVFKTASPKKKAA